MAYLNTIEQPAARNAAGPSAAFSLAAANLAANRSALAGTQPRLADVVDGAPPDLEFIFARDGYLTAFDDDGRWWSGCSLPKRASAAMLRPLKVNGPVSCFLVPPHAASVRVGLDMTAPAHAILVVAPDLHALSLLLACDDFSDEIRLHRLWFAWGTQWAAELNKLLDERPGLPTPSQFIRLPISEAETIEPMIQSAQAMFSAALARRAALAQEMREAWRPMVPRRSPGLCVLTTRHFTLWDDAAFTLGAALSRMSHHGDAETVAVYLDEPLHGSPLAMLSAALECEALVTADVARADIPDLLPVELPWITWLTMPRVPAFAGAGPKDFLLVADGGWKRRALDAGWPADRVGLARWPDLPAIWASDPLRVDDETIALATAPGRPALAIIADTRSLDAPPRLEDFSSQRLLWNSIREELEAEPLLLAGADPGDYLEERLKRFRVSGDGLDRGLFVEGLIVPCYGQGIARLLLGAGLPLRLFGAGWGDQPEFAPYAAGAIGSRRALAQAAAGAAALVHVWPITHVHPIEAAGRRVVGPMNNRTDMLIRDATSALTSRGRGEANPIQSDSLGEALELGKVLRVAGIGEAPWRDED